uniref:Uncharacterized protein n=1 Tax=Molossus molossus TaxID=27622 RepID=A0A7J8FSG7_MOLMO|nr:hypothetical protein HJG59_008446 [Molossus molossus]
MSTVSSDPFLLGSCVHGPEDAVPCSELGAGTEGGGCRVRGAGLNGGGHGEDQASEDTVGGRLRNSAGEEGISAAGGIVPAPTGHGGSLHLGKALPPSENQSGWEAVAPGKWHLLPTPIKENKAGSPSLSREHRPGHSSGGSPKAQGQRSTLATHFGSPRSKIPRPHGLLFPLDTFLSSYANSVDTEASFMRDGLRGPDRCQVMSVRRALQETDSEHLWETD